MIKKVPQRKMNSYRYEFLRGYKFVSDRFESGMDSLGNYGEWQSGDFIIHVPGIPNERKVKILQDMLGKVVGI